MPFQTNRTENDYCRITFRKLILFIGVEHNQTMETTTSTKRDAARLELLIKAQEGDQKATNLLIQDLTPMMHGILRTHGFFELKNVDRDEILSVAMETLWNSIRAYNIEEGCGLGKLSNYLGNAIHHNVWNYIYANVYKKDAEGNPIYFVRLIDSEGNDLTERFDLTNADTVNHPSPITAFNLDSEEAIEFIDTTAVDRPDEEEQDYDNTKDLTIAEKTVKALLSSIPDNERYVIERLYGINGCQQETAQDISRRFGVSIQTILNIQTRAIRNMKTNALKQHVVYC